MLKQLGQAFSSAEYRIEHVMTGADALKSIFNDPPSIILLDPQLPDRCGLELHRTMRSWPSSKALTIIYSSRSMIVNCCALFALLLKPRLTGAVRSSEL